MCNFMSFGVVSCHMVLCRVMSIGQSSHNVLVQNQIFYKDVLRKLERFQLEFFYIMQKNILFVSFLLKNNEKNAFIFQIFSLFVFFFQIYMHIFRFSDFFSFCFFLDMYHLPIHFYYLFVYPNTWMTLREVSFKIFFPWSPTHRPKKLKITVELLKPLVT